MIQEEIDRLKQTDRRPRLWAASTGRIADLANLAKALRDASAARLAALGDAE